jgi:glycosyltransferase involved in cell wall biosynthesis
MSKKSFSLIMATYGRKQEVENYLISIINSDYETEKVQIIIVDQNDEIDLSNIVKVYKDKLNIVYIKSKVKGLAINRNIGLKHATGDVIAFPDDDCEYLKDTLSNINNIFNEDECDLLMGRIVERDGSDSLRKWPKEIININKINFYTKCSSITMFFKASKCLLRFNNRLGVGTHFGSCEDTDILYKNLKNNIKAVYNPNVKIYHPHYNPSHNMTKEKVVSYGLGFGAFIKSNFDVYTAILFFKANTYHLVKMILSILKFNFEAAEKSFKAFNARLQGFFKYRCKSEE